MNELPVSTGFAPVFIHIAGQVFPFRGMREASESYMAASRRLDLGASDMPCCDLIDAGGIPVRYVSYNGRVWEKRGESWCDDVLVYDPPTRS